MGNVSARGKSMMLKKIAVEVRNKIVKLENSNASEDKIAKYRELQDRIYKLMEMENDKKNKR